MTPEEIKQLAEVLKDTQKPNDSMKFLDFAFKAISTVSIGLVVWTLTTVNSMQLDMAGWKSDAVYTRETLKKLEDFATAPRFTKQDFDALMNPVITKLATNTAEISQIEKEITEINLQIQQLQLAIDK